MIKQNKLLFVGLLAVLVLSACGSQPTAAPAQSSAPTAEAQPVQAATSVPTEALVNVPAATEPVAQPPASTVSFAKDLQPMFQDSCVSCHGGEKTSRALDLKTYASLMAGSQNGAVIAPGDAAASKLVQAIQSGKMPKRGAKWTADQIQLLVDWVNAGAQNN
jgi:mono/diheme cytochrome c family protein